FRRVLFRSQGSSGSGSGHRSRVLDGQAHESGARSWVAGGTLARVCLATVGRAHGMAEGLTRPFGAPLPRIPHGVTCGHRTESVSLTAWIRGNRRERTRGKA